MVSQKTVDSQSGQAGQPPRLWVDAMLGKLARWLRMAGYDTEFWREGSDEALMAAAHEQGRLIVTKDHGLAGRRGVHALLVESEGLDDQIGEALSALQRYGPAPEPFTRCAGCNGVLAHLPHEDAQSLVPPYVWHTQRELRRCTGCGRIYWKGTHWPAVQSRLIGLNEPSVQGEDEAPE